MTYFDNIGNPCEHCQDYEAELFRTELELQRLREENRLFRQLIVDINTKDAEANVAAH